MTWDELDLQATPEGVCLRLRVLPGARANAIKGVHDGRLKIAVTAAPEKGKANKAVRQFLARQLGLARSQIEFTQGLTSQDKTIEVSGVTVSQMRQLLRKAVDL